MRNGTRTLIFVVALSSMAGCAPMSKVTRLENDARAREERLVAVEGQLSGQREDLEALTARAQEQITSLETILEQATQAVTRNSADLGVEVEAMRAELGRVQGAIAEIRNELSSSRVTSQQELAALTQHVQRIANQTGVDLSLAESEIPADADAHLLAAAETFGAGDFSKARALYQAFVARYPRHERADDALYNVGVTYMRQNRPQSAVPVFQRVLRDYRTGDAVDDTLLVMGDAFFELRSCTDAKNAYNALISGHGSSPLVASARTKLRTVEAAPRAQCTP